MINQSWHGSPTAETRDLKSRKCGFESHPCYQVAIRINWLRDEIGKRTRLKIERRKACGFESHRSYCFDLTDLKSQEF